MDYADRFLFGIYPLICHVWSGFATLAYVTRAFRFRGASDAHWIDIRQSRAEQSV